MNGINPLLLLQICSMTTTILLGMMLALSATHISNINRNYEKTRWLLFTAMVIMSLHYLAQMLFGFRAEGDDVGALINMLFYTPVAYIISHCITRMTCDIRHQRIHNIVGCVSIFLSIATFCIGWTIFRSMHIQWMLYLMGGIFMLSISYFIFTTIKQIRRAQKTLEKDAGGDITQYNMYTYTGTILLCSTAAVVPVAIFFEDALYIFGPIFFASLFYYILSFVILGFRLPSIAEVIDNNLRNADTKEDAEAAQESIDEDTCHTIDSQIEGWIQQRGYTDPDININSLARRLNIDKKLFTAYLQQQKGTTFRIWISTLRIEEMKRLLIEHDQYSNENIAQECGFSSRTWMQQRFKAVTGMTPNEWKEMKRKEAATGATGAPLPTSPKGEESE